MFLPVWQHAACRQRLHLSTPSHATLTHAPAATWARHMRTPAPRSRAHTALAQTSACARQPLALACNGTQAVKYMWHER
eukprot:6211982-Pleurochrysis_carterae.AAC.2